MPIRSYRDLDVWNVSIELIQQSYLLTRRYPREEIYCLTSQTRRSSISVATNIAEGHGRVYVREYLHHLSIAKGSLNELQTLILVAEQLGYIEPGESQPVAILLERVARMLNRLIARIESRASRRNRTPNPDLRIPIRSSGD